MLDDSSNGVVINSSADEGTTTFIQVKGVDTKDIELRNNRMRKARNPVSFENESVKKTVTIDKS